MHADMQAPPAQAGTTWRPATDHVHDVDLDEAGAASAATVFGLLSDPTRLAVVWHLRTGERSVNELARLVDRPAPAVSQHLARLRLSRLVSTRKDGTTVHYRLESTHVGNLVVDALSHAQHTQDERVPR